MNFTITDDGRNILTLLTVIKNCRKKVNVILITIEGKLRDWSIVVQSRIKA